MVRRSPTLALKNWKSGVMSTDCIFVSSGEVELFSTSRTLNNYLRRDSHRLWSYHLAMMFIDGFSPMIPLHFDAHKSQTD